VVAALVADLTRSSVRTVAMAILGAGVGFAFLVAMVLGPVFSGWIGVDGIFRMTGVLALLAIPLVLFAVPREPDVRQAKSGSVWDFRWALTDPQLLRYYGGVFLLHMMMMILFQAAPYAMIKTLGLPVARHWLVYLPVMIASTLPVFPLIRWAEGKGHAKPVFLSAIAVLGLALLIAAAASTVPIGLWAAMLLFFFAFTYLEGSLPSMISRYAPPSQKGAALGVFSTAQVLGGAGAPLGGYLYQHWGLAAAFAGPALLSVIWLSFAVGQAAPHKPVHSGEVTT
jgi:predicted MFS family arabinose efflux permease